MSNLHTKVSRLVWQRLTKTARPLKEPAGVQALQVANYLVAAYSSPYRLTNTRLNRLLYYAQVESLRQADKLLFDDVIEAWPCGPVVPAVTRAYEEWGSGPIGEDSEGLSVGARAIIDSVVKTYGALSDFDLISLTRRVGGAWTLTYNQDDIEVTGAEYWAKFLDEQDAAFEVAKNAAPEAARDAAREATKDSACEDSGEVIRDAIQVAAHDAAQKASQCTPQGASQGDPHRSITIATIEDSTDFRGLPSPSQTFTHALAAAAASTPNTLKLLENS